LFLYFQIIFFSDDNLKKAVLKHNQSFENLSGNIESTICKCFDSK